MPFKSKAQRRKFAQLLVEGEITPETFEEWNRETGGAHLPERVGKKPRRPQRPRRKRKSTRAATARKKKVARAGTRRSGVRKKRSTTRRRAARK
jgi:hypothetical protein